VKAFKISYSNYFIFCSCASQKSFFHWAIFLFFIHVHRQNGFIIFFWSKRGSDLMLIILLLLFNSVSNTWIDFLRSKIVVIKRCVCKSDLNKPKWRNRQRKAFPSVRTVVKYRFFFCNRNSIYVLLLLVCMEMASKSFYPLLIEMNVCCMRPSAMSITISLFLPFIPHRRPYCHDPMLSASLFILYFISSMYVLLLMFVTFCVTTRIGSGLRILYLVMFYFTCRTGLFLFILWNLEIVM